MIETVKHGDTSHTMKTVNQEDKTAKRVREEGTYIAETTKETRFKFRYNKKPKLNLVDKEKETIEILEEEDPEKNIDVATVIENEQEMKIQTLRCLKNSKAWRHPHHSRQRIQTVISKRNIKKSRPKMKR